MKTYLVWILFILVSLTATTALSETPTFTNVTVSAHEYYDYYAQPQAQWQKVTMLKIEGRNNAGNTQVYQSGPEELLEATLFNVSVPSEYWVTVVWEGGERTSQSFVATPQKDTIHNIYNP
jgi:hypothetical protein